MTATTATTPPLTQTPPTQTQLGNPLRACSPRSTGVGPRGLTADSARALAAPASSPALGRTIADPEVAADAARPTPVADPRPAPRLDPPAVGPTDDPTVDVAGLAWSTPEGDSDEAGLRLTLTRASVDDEDDEPGWQPLGERVRLASGRRVPGTRYRIVRWLGEGGMGMVFEAIHVDIQRPVALKILKPGIAGSELQRERFLAEARAVASVESRFVVDVLDFGELPDGRPFYTMELLDPLSLADALRDGPLPLARALPILRQCCKALAAVHERGMAHRDIKPQNVLLQREDDRADAVRIVDFGIAAKFGSQPRIAGTAMYMAPEQIRGVAFDGRLDIYGLGCVAYELLTGAPPFQGASAAEVVQNHLHEPAAAASTRATPLGAQLDQLLGRCLAKQPEDRYPDMHAVEAALCEIQIAAGFTTPWDDLPLPGVSADQREQLRRRMPQAHPERRGRGPRLRLAFGLATAAFVVGLASAGALSAGSPPAADDPQLARELDVAMTAIRDKTEAARVAGSRAYWAYPPPEQPDYPTALRMIAALEREPGPLRQLARLRASELREEFAETLVRLGDQYWSAENGRPFAVEFYAQALLFDGEQPRAQARTSLTPAQLADVAARASSGELSAIEVEIGAALRALSDQDPGRRRERVERLLAEGSPLASSLRLQAQLSAVVGIDAPSPSSAGAPTLGPPPPPAVVPPSGALPSADSSTKSRIRPKPSSVTADAESDTERAQGYTRKARAALAKGDRDRAERLFGKALALAPRLADAHAGLAEIHFARGRYQEAMTAARRATRARPDDADLQLLLGDACLKTLRYADARSAYEHARALGHAKARQRLAQLDEVSR